MYRRVGLDPTKTRPSNEALLRRVRRGDPFPRVNALVDAVNLCSLEWQLPYGVYDRRRIGGPVTLRLGADGEDYAGIRKDTVHVAGRLTVGRRRRPVRQPDLRLGADDGDAGDRRRAGRGLRAGVGAAGRGRRACSTARPRASRRPSAGARAGGGRMTRPPFVSAILAAGGLGSAPAAAVPKQFLDLGGQTLLERSLAALAAHPRVTRSSWRCRRRISTAAGLPGGRRGRAPCGRSRAARGARIRWRARSRWSAPTADVVLVHDAARPFVSAALIDRDDRRRAGGGAAVPAVPARDTVKRGVARDGAHWVGRDAAARRDLPGADAAGVPPRACSPRRFAPAGDDDATDEAGLVERAGGAVHLVEGEAANVKITTADDLAAARPRRRGDRRCASAPATTCIAWCPAGALVLAGVRGAVRARASTATPTPTSSATR